MPTTPLIVPSRYIAGKLAPGAALPKPSPLALSTIGILVQAPWPQLVLRYRPLAITAQISPALPSGTDSMSLHVG